MTVNTSNLLRAAVLRARSRSHAGGLLAVISAALLAGACSADLSTIGGAEPASNNLVADAAKQSKGDLDKAIEYWGTEHKKKPTDLKAGLSYARNLKAAGQKEQSFAVLQSLALLHGDSTELASEYGRLALDLGQVQIAQQVLAMADDPMKPDWRIISALGTVQAKQGKYGDAIPFYERALTLAPDQPSVLNNLAMAHAANGEPGKAEDILRRLSEKDGDTKIKQNLALVLGLQSKHEDARNVAATSDLPPGAAKANTDYVRSMVKDAPPTATAAATPAAASPSIAAPAAAAPARVASTSPKRQKTGAAAATAAAASKPTELRESAGPAAVAAPLGVWDTTVARVD